MNLYKLLIGLVLCLPISFAFSANDRIALVIGNSKYEELGLLKNTSNDARSIDKALREMGFKTKLVIDDNHASLRRDIRNFANESEGASLAVIFYAGHGAQVNGENYLLPTDIEIPKRESDIQLSAVKVDDVINSLKSKTKVVFLDACRDNPALVRSLSKGRGSYRGGLAPAKSSSFDDQSSGVFIAYATDSGNVALDGDGQSNSPFTQALLKYIKQPVSIDDMFSMVTKDVRQETKNAQKPYKYASLDGVVCLSGKCGLEGIRISEGSSSTSTPPQAETTSASQQANWVLFNRMPAPQESLIYMDPKSIKKLANNKITVRLKFVLKDGLQGEPNYAYHIVTDVLDCKALKGNGYLVETYDKNNKLLNENQSGNPLTIQLQDFSDKSSAGFSAIELVCNPNKFIPLVSNSESNSSTQWERQYNDVTNGWDFYAYKPSTAKKSDTYNAIGKYVYKTPTKAGQLKLFGNTLVAPIYENDSGAPLVKTLVVKNYFDCKNRKFKLLFDNFLDEDGGLVLLTNYFSEYTDLAEPVPLSENTPFEGYFKFVCSNY